MGADPHGHAIHVRAGNVPVVDTRDAATPLVQVPRGTRLPGVTRAAGPLGVNHEVPAREGGPDGRPGARLPGPRAINEAPVVVVVATTPPGGATGVVGAPAVRRPLLPAPPAAAPPLGPRKVLRAPPRATRAPVATLPTTGILPRQAALGALVGVGSPATRTSTRGAALNLVETVRAGVRLLVAALVDASRTTSDAPNEVAAVPTAPIGLGSRIETGTTAPPLGGVVVVPPVPGLLLRAGVRGVPTAAQGREAVTGPKVLGTNVGPLGRPRRGLPRRAATGKAVESGVARHGSALVGVVSGLRVLAGATGALVAVVALRVRRPQAAARQTVAGGAGTAVAGPVGTRVQRLARRVPVRPGKGGLGRPIRTTNEASKALITTGRRVRSAHTGRVRVPQP